MARKLRQKIYINISEYIIRLLTYYSFIPDNKMVKQCSSEQGVALNIQLVPEYPFALYLFLLSHTHNSEIVS